MWNNTTESGSAEDGVTTRLINIGLVTMYFIEGSAIILTNLLTIITFTINRHLRKRSMYCVINLAVADMLLGVEELVSRALMWKLHGGIELDLFKDNLVQNSVLWRTVFLTSMGSGTMLSLALVAVERMCATVWPLRLRNARPWAYTLAISMTWTAAAMSGPLLAICIRLMPNPLKSADELRNALFGVSVVVVVGVICLSYTMIFIEVKRQQQQMAGQRISRRDQRLAMTLFIVTVASIGTLIPMALVFLLTAWDAVFPYYIYGALSGLAFSNSLINPIIYVLRMKDFRKALLHLILTCSRHRRTLVGPQPNKQQTTLQLPMKII